MNFILICYNSANNIQVEYNNKSLIKQSMFLLGILGSRVEPIHGPYIYRYTERMHKIRDVWRPVVILIIVQLYYIMIFIFVRSKENWVFDKL